MADRIVVMRDGAIEQIGDTAGGLPHASQPLCGAISWRADDQPARLHDRATIRRTGSMHAPQWPFAV